MPPPIILRHDRPDRLPVVDVEPAPAWNLQPSGVDAHLMHDGRVDVGDVVAILDGVETEAGLNKTPEFALMLRSVMFERLRFLAARLATRDVAKAKISSRSEPVFDAATLKVLEDKLERATVVRFYEGRQIMKEGNPGTTMYIVLEGRVTIAINNKIVEKLVPGGVFGEMALVDQSPRTASAIARTDCALLSINRDTLVGLVKSDPAVGMAMMRCVADRMRYMNSLFT